MTRMNDALDMTFAALADSTRRAILAKLALGEASVTELAEPFAMSLPAISRHLKVLERAGLIARGREAQWRPCRIEAQGFRDVAEWMEEYRSVWAGRLDRMQSYVERLHAEAERGADKATKTRTKEARKKASKKGLKARR
jgi:DNA-binding transcriptional ArsR family regulator